tara:strand:- start:323 stop:1156 length:834 start_codon:yes stop_codon:yes gene_type:complete
MEAFNTNENKAFLWDILSKKGIFNGHTSNTIHPKFENLFDQIITKHYTSKSSPNTMALNKEFLSGFVNLMRHSEKSTNSTTNKGDTLEKIYDTNQIRKDMVDDFNKEFTTKQNEFQETIRLKRPDEVDFADKNNEEPIDSSRIDELLKQQLEKRNLDIPKISETSQEFKNAADWIGNNTNTVENDSVAGFSSNGNGNAVNNNNSPDKVVSFKDNLDANYHAPPSVSVENRHTSQPPRNKPSLKNGLLNNDATQKKLDEILENQKYIINAIHELLDRR